jgi:hypothetical protein
MMNHFRMRPVSEADVRSVVEAAGGRIAHPDYSARTNIGADFVLGNAIVELKALEDEGLTKPERQVKLAELFQCIDAGRPVVVIDRNRLDDSAKRDFDRIMEGPVRTAVASARKQLKQSRNEIADAKCSILMVINNGYTALDHKDLVNLVAHRVRQDTREIDGVVVAGCYMYSDTFDTFCLWHINYVPINVDRRFEQYENLRRAWDELANRVMTRLITQVPGKEESKLPVRDVTFSVEGVTFVKPAPQMGKRSDFFVNGRPRSDSSSLIELPPVATTFADLTISEWTKFRRELPGESWLKRTWDDWRLLRARVMSEATLKPVVYIAVTFEGWAAWKHSGQHADRVPSVANYANELFVDKVRALCDQALDRNSMRVLPASYVLAVTEEIGQDRANDVSHIELINENNNKRRVRPLMVNQRMFHEHAVIKATAIAIALGIDIVLWEKDLTYGWT